LLATLPAPECNSIFNPFLNSGISTKDDKMDRLSANGDIHDCFFFIKSLLAAQSYTKPNK
jgi:hypothetical protein